MPEEEKRILPAVAIIPVGLGLAAIVAIAALAWAAPPTMYTCPYCGATFATEEELYEHIRIEHPEEPPVFACPYCGATFTTQAELDAHIETEHPPEAFTCPYCGATFATQEELDAHIAIEHPEPPPVGVLVPCVYCGATFTTEEQLIAHMEANHPGKPYLISLAAPSWMEESRKGHWVTVGVSGKGFVPNTPSGYDLSICTYIYSEWGAARLYRTGYGASVAEFFESTGHLMGYGVTQSGVYYVPVGIYSIMSLCYITTSIDGYERGYMWKDADTGLVIEVVEAPPPEADIVISRIRVRPATIYVGDTVELTVMTSNQGELAGSREITVKVNGVILDTITITLNPGQSKGYFFYFIPEEAGTYLAEADGVTESFEVL